MTNDQPPTPGPDEIMVAAATRRTVCHARGHARIGVQAEVVVTLGDLGTHWQPGALWQDCWGQSYSMCGECWQATRQVAQGRRPALVITGIARDPAG